MTKLEIQHACFAVTVFSLFFRAAGDPVALTAFAIATGFVAIALADHFGRTRAPR